MCIFKRHVVLERKDISPKAVKADLKKRLMFLNESPDHCKKSPHVHWRLIQTLIRVSARFWVWAFWGVGIFLIGSSVPGRLDVSLPLPAWEGGRGSRPAPYPLCRPHPQLRFQARQRQAAHSVRARLGRPSMSGHTPSGGCT